MEVALTEALQAFDSGITAFKQRRIHDALKHFCHAENNGHDAEECCAYRWQCWMLLGDFENAWRESDRIAERSREGADCLWDGLPFAGKRVVIRCLHGYGDAIQFLRYAPLVRQSAARVIVETHPEMVSLLKGVPGVDSVITWADGNSLKRADWDQQSEVMELPRAFRTTIETIPLREPYIGISPEAVAQSRRHMGSSGKPKIGILWGSSGWNPARSLSLRQFVPILELEEFSFYSFQRGSAREELKSLPRHLTIQDTSSHSHSISDTAADLMNIDLLITVDTMAAHLAGALGVPVWTLLIHDSDWRWMLDREDSPWYPSMRLFRQPQAGDWASVMRRVAAELRSFGHRLSL